MPCRSIFSGCRQESSQKLYSTGWTDGQKISTGAMEVPCSREHVLVDLNLSSALVEPILWNQSTGASEVLCSREHVLVDFNCSSAPVEPTLQNQSTGAIEVLCSRELVWIDQWNSSAPVEPMPLRSMRRCNEASPDTVSEPQRLQLGHRDRLNRRLNSDTHRFFRCSRFFCSGLPTAM